jgi:hypothetical protein
MPDYTIENQTFTWRLRQMVKDLDKECYNFGNISKPGYVNLILAKNKIEAAIIEIEDN